MPTKFGLRLVLVTNMLLCKKVLCVQNEDIYIYKMILVHRDSHSPLIE